MQGELQEVVLRSSQLPLPQASRCQRELASGSWPGADACKWVRRWVWEQPASSKPFCQHCLLGHGCLRAPGPAKCDCPLAPVGAAVRPTWYPAWPSLTMWQVWTAAHNRAQLPVPPAKEPDAAIGKNCFTIWNLSPLIIAQRGWRGEVQSGGLKMPVSPCIHQCLLYCLLSGTILLMFSFLQPSNSCSAFPSPQGRKEKWVEGEYTAACSFLTLYPWPCPCLGVIYFLFVPVGFFLWSQWQCSCHQPNAVSAWAAQFILHLAAKVLHSLSFRQLEPGFQKHEVFQRQSPGSALPSEDSGSCITGLGRVFLIHEMGRIVLWRILH